MTYTKEQEELIAKISDIRLPGLDGMLPGGKVKAREKTTLDVLADTCKLLVDNLSQDLEQNVVSNKFEESVYSKIYGKLKHELFRDVLFDEDDLRSFIGSKTTKRDTLGEARVIGMYTGCLLELLTERNREQGERTIFCINGYGNRFDYLFYLAKNIDSLIVNNFEGDLVCGNVASYQGSADFIILTNNKDGSGLGGNIVADKGRIDLVVAANNEGESMLDSVAYNEGKASIVYVSKCKGDDIGHNIGAYNGDLGLVVGKDCDGNDIFKAVGIERPEHTFDDINRRDKGYVRTVAIVDYKGTYEKGKTRGQRILDMITLGKVDYLLLYNVGEDLGVYFTNPSLIKGKRALEEFTQLSYKYRLVEILDIVNLITENTSHKEMKAMAEKIDTIYQDIKPKLRGMLKHDIRRRAN